MRHEVARQAARQPDQASHFKITAIYDRSEVFLMQVDHQPSGCRLQVVGRVQVRSYYSVHHQLKTTSEVEDERVSLGFIFYLSSDSPFSLFLFYLFRALDKLFCLCNRSTVGAYSVRITSDTEKLQASEDDDSFIHLVIEPVFKASHRLENSSLLLLIFPCIVSCRACQSEPGLW